MAEQLKKCREEFGRELLLLLQNQNTGLDKTQLYAAAQRVYGPVVTESLINTDVKPRRHHGLLSSGTNQKRRPPEFRTIQSLQARDGCKLIYRTQFTFGDQEEREQTSTKLHSIADSFCCQGAIINNTKAKRVQFTFGKSGELCADGKAMEVKRFGPPQIDTETELRDDLNLDKTETVLAVYDRDDHETGSFVIVREEEARIIIYLHGMFAALQDTC